MSTVEPVEIGDADTLLLDPDLVSFLSDEELAEYLELIQVCERIDGTWALQPRQQTAEDRCDQLMAEGQVFELLYGGAGAGGKSEWLLFHLHRLALRFPGFSGLLVRRTYKELERTAILRSLARFDRRHATYQVSHKRWRFDNGSIIEFGYCESDADVFQYDSAEYDVVAWDELTQFPTDYPYRYLFSRVRTDLSKSVRGLTPHVVAGTNPHRTGVAWVKPRFVDIGQWEQIHYINTDLEDGSERRVGRVFIPAKMTDNRFVNVAAYRSMLSILDESTRKAIEEGSWDVVEGQYFTEWNRALHVIEPFKIPANWRRFAGYDFGIANPAAHLWIAVDGDGVGYVYREMYRRELTVQQQADLILRSEAQGEIVDYRVADPSIWTRTGAGPPIAQQFLQARVPFRKANNARIDGWARLRDYLRPSRRLSDPETGQTWLDPMLKIFSTCPDLIRTLPLLVHDPKKPEDVDTEGEDHAPDALRYGIMSRPLKVRPPVEDEIVNPDVVKVNRSGRGDLFDHPILGRLHR